MKKLFIFLFSSALIGFCVLLFGFALGLKATNSVALVAAFGLLDFVLRDVVPEGDK